MKVLLTGSDGYLGSLLPTLLTRRGHSVKGIDTSFYKSGWLYQGTDTTPETLTKDIRRLTFDDLYGFDAVVHMAELSNDPTGQLAPHITYAINHQGSVKLAKLAKRAGIQRFVYMSSCSIYGVATEDRVRETSPTNPQTTYARCKQMVEQDVSELADHDFSPTFLRNATAFGASPRMRFDLVLNNLAGLAWTTGKIAMTSNGTPWRPLVHAMDIGKAIACTLEAERDIIHNQIFNVGDSAHNYQVKDIAAAVADTFPNCQLSLGTQGSDNRSYRVSFEKINTTLPGFSCDWDVKRGAQQLHDLFSLMNLDAETFAFRGFTRLKQLEYLLKTQQIDSDFYWSNAACNLQKQISKVPALSH
ncbi:MAG: SDR family oxidoreductase [Cyanobacteria bacterium P01_A01_bin.17]